jgi:hypothetical protein
MSVVSFKTSMPTVTPPTSGGGSSTPASGSSSMGKYLFYGAILVAIGYGVYKFVIEPRMKANREYDDD